MAILDLIHAYGHHNVLCTHKSTIEITKKNYLSKRGDCILGVNASKSCKELNLELKKIIRKEKKIKVIIKIGDLTDTFYGFGNKNLALRDEEDLVFRKSRFLCDRTVLINCNKAAKDLDPKLIEKLKIPNTKFSICFEINDEN
ncbi:MAG: DUF371 domain-containing protein [Promethearchaeota archaeon]|nr:MAG: DUF371 domain-containing protein [Candidatus Lokiarchaeota archaeon]